MTGLAGKVKAVAALAVLAMVVVVGFTLFPINPGSPFGSPEARPVRKGPQPAPTSSDAVYVHITGSWDTGRTAAMTYTAGQSGTMPACGDIVCAESPTKLTIQVRHGDLVVVSVVATAKRGAAFCSIRLRGERDAELVKPHKNSVLDTGAVDCSRVIP